MGWELEGVWHHQTGLQQLPGERKPPKISPGTTSAAGSERGDTESLSQPSPASLASLAGWEFIHSGRKLFTVAAIKQPLGEGLWKECVVVRVGCRSDPRTDFLGRAAGQVLG